ncbi:MAG: hypothetical protein ACYC0C_03795 [Devosia sp.]
MSANARRLLVVPMVHSNEDFGSQLETFRASFVAQFGPAEWERRSAALAGFWDAVSRVLDDLSLDYTKVKIFQDSLPVVPEAKQMVLDQANKGSRNHRLIEKLAARGATIVGTESIELLIDEYRLVKEQIDDPAAIRRSVEARDRFIAKRISSTLNAGETGILFIGAAHNVGPLLAPDIEVAVLGST